MREIKVGKGTGEKRRGKKIKPLDTISCARMKKPLEKGGVKKELHELGGKSNCFLASGEKYRRRGKKAGAPNSYCGSGCQFQ